MAKKKSSEQVRCEHDRKQIKNYKRMYEKYGAKDQFIQFFAKRFFDLTQDQDKRTKLNNLGQGVIPPNVNSLITEMMNKLWLDVTSRCGKYMEREKKHNKLRRSKYWDLLQDTTNSLTRAIQGLDPIKTSKKIDSLLIPNEFDPRTTLTPERFKQFVDELRTTDKQNLPKDIRFTAQDVQMIIKLYNKLLASILQCDKKDEIAKLTSKVIRHALDGNKEEKKKIVTQYGNEIRQLCGKQIALLTGNSNVKDKYPATKANLRKLLNFVHHIFPSNDDTKRINQLLEAAEENNESLLVVYDQIRGLLVNLILEHDQILINLITQVGRLWDQIKVHPGLNEFTLPLITSSQNPEVYLGDLVYTLQNAKHNLIDWTKSCSNKTWNVKGYGEQIDANCKNVIKVAVKLDTIISDLNTFIANSNYENVKNLIQRLASQKVTESIISIANEKEYSQLLKQLGSDYVRKVADIADEY